MKNLKKALSLVLASAMLIGMMVVGTGAAHSDVKAEHNEEAIAVVSAAGIMGAGDTFNPDGKMTRGEMAVVMVNLLDLDVADYKGASNFTDAGWAADYIDACYANGIMAGVSATEFGTNTQVTTAQAALMMLKALGYFELKPINDWMLDTIKKAAEIDLLEGIDAKASAVLTRNEVAQLVFNTLMSNTVEEKYKDDSSSTSIKGEGFEITIGAGVTTEPNEETLMDELFDGEFYTEASETAIGLPGYTWFQENEDKDEDPIEIIVMEYEVADVAVVDDQKTALELYKDEVDKKFKGEVKLVNADELKAGDEVHFIKIDKNHYEAYAVSYELVEISSVKETTKKGVTTVKVNGITVADGVEVDVEKGDWALIAKHDGKIGDIKDAEIIEGEVTAKKSGKFTVDGSKYVDLTGKVKVGDEIKAVLDNAGRIAVVIESETTVSDDLAYIYNVTKATEKETNEDGVKSEEDVYTVYVVLADGSKDKYTVEEDSAEAVLAAEGTVVAYTLNKDDEFEIAENENLYTGKVTLDKNHKSVTTEDGKVYADSKTEFIFADWNSKNKMIVTTATGIKNVEIKDQVAYMICDDDAIVTVFVLAEDAGLTVDADTEYGFVVDAAAVETMNDDDEIVYTYVVYVDDEEIELTFEKEQKFSKMQVIAFEMDGDYAELVDGELKSKTIEYIGEDFVEIDGVYYTADEAVIYVATKTIDEDGEETFEYAEGSLEDALDNEVKVELLINKDKEIELGFYTIVVDEREED